MKLSDLLLLGGAGYAAYWLYTNWLKPTPGGAVDTAETAIANTIVSLTSPSQVPVSSSLVVQFPDGSQVPASTVISGPMTWPSDGSNPLFTYNGSTWSLAPQVNNVYQATQLSGLGSYASVRRNLAASLGDLDNDPYFLRGVMR